MRINKDVHFNQCNSIYLTAIALVRFTVDKTKQNETNNNNRKNRN